MRCAHPHNRKSARFAEMKQLLLLSSVLVATSCTGQFAAGPGGSGPANSPANNGYAAGNGQPTSGGEGINNVGPTAPTGPAIFGNTIDEQKAVTESERILEEALIAARAKCGLSVLKATIVWTDYLAFKDSDFEGRSRANVYSIAGGQLEGAIRQMGDSCSDPIVKNAVASKLREIVGHPRIGLVNANNPSHLYTAANGTISVTYHFGTSNTDTTQMLKVL